MRESPKAYRRGSNSKSSELHKIHHSKLLILLLGGHVDPAAETGVTALQARDDANTTGALTGSMIIETNVTIPALENTTAAIIHTPTHTRDMALIRDAKQ